MNPSPVEIAGVVFGLAYVVLAIRENPWCWPVGIGNALLFLAVYANARLYGLAGLQVVYAAVSVYGWYEWRHGGRGHGRLVVSRVPPRWAVGLALAGSAASLALGLLLKHGTDAALPFRDGAITAFSLVAQWMATRKWLENWPVWMVLNVANTAVCVSQGLFPMAAFYGLLLVLAVVGFREWSRSLDARGAAAPTGPEGA